MEEGSDPNIGHVIVAFRRVEKPNGHLLPLTEDDVYQIHINDILEMTAIHSVYVSDNKTFISKNTS